MKKRMLIAYVPALHAGYINLFRRYRGVDCYILGLELIKELPHLERDLRALKPREARAAVEALDIFSNVKLLTRTKIRELAGARYLISMPSEDIMHQLAKEYGIEKKVKFESVFLRWDRWTAQAKGKPLAHHDTTSVNFHKNMIRRAYQEAEKSPDWWRQVGAVSVRGKKILFTGYNIHLPRTMQAYIEGDPRSNFDAGEEIDKTLSHHAEKQIIDHAARDGVMLKNTSLYVTTFPCPGCARDICEAGIKKVFYHEGYSLLDSEEIFKAKGVKLIRVRL